MVLAAPLARMLQLCLSPASSPQINLVQCGVTPTTPARPGKVHELWEDWTLRRLENGRRRSQVGRGAGGGREVERWFSVCPGLPGARSELFLTSR